MRKVIVAEDEKVTRLALSRILQREGLTVIEAADGREALELFRAESPALVVLDIQMPVLDGREVMRHIKEESPSIPVIVITSQADVDTAVEMMRLGAYDFLSKPVEPGKLVVTARRALERFSLEREVERLHGTEDTALEWMLGRSGQMRKTIGQIKQVADTDFSVILEGETGTGKSFTAKLIHRLSKRARKPFVKVDLGAIPETLSEAELFGYERGAFTGATMARKGYFESAGGGTLFIDDLENLSPLVQAKLLSAVEDKQIHPLGRRDPVPVDVRVISASNRNLGESIREGRFREDLFFRLGEFGINLVPLRERPEDIDFFAAKFLEATASELDKDVVGFRDDAMVFLHKHPWAGNVRELKNVVRRAVLIAGDRLVGMEHLEFMSGPRASEAELALPQSLREAVGTVERAVIARTLDLTKGNKTLAASMLKIDIKTLRTKMAEHSIE